MNTLASILMNRARVDLVLIRAPVMVAAVNMTIGAGRTILSLGTHSVS